LLGVDYGKARTGLALSDPMGVICRPLVVLTGREEGKVIEAILAAALEHEAKGIVVGVPRPLSGGTNEQMQEVLSFVDRLRSEAPVPVDTWDERFTTCLAEKGNRGNSPRDAVAACYMLQNYLDKLTAENRGYHGSQRQ
jgi:putative Holliday junction resolvase